MRRTRPEHPDIDAGDAEWTVACLGDRLRHPAPGMAGGGEGGPGGRSICGEAVPQPKLSHTVPAVGEVSLHLPGGGGFGPPEERDRELVEADLRDGRITGWPAPLSTMRSDGAGPPPENAAGP